jgi:hypothetical protein
MNAKDSVINKADLDEVASVYVGRQRIYSIIFIILNDANKHSFFLIFKSEASNPCVSAQSASSVFPFRFD